MTNKNIGYHFTGETLLDGRPIPAIEETLVHDGPIVVCKSGLHWSREPFDALKYAPGPYLHMVSCSDPEVEETDKCASRERTIVKSMDATHLIRRFTADLALSVAHLWSMPKVVREYLEALDEEKRAAASGAAMAAAWGDTSVSHSPLAAIVAWYAARSADSVWGVAGYAVDTAKVSESRKDFNRRVYDAFEKME